MRRLLPVFFCVAASTGLVACDQDQDSLGLYTDEEQQVFYDAARAAGGFPGAPAYADGDVALSRPAGGGGGGDIIIWDIVDSIAFSASGATVQVLTTDAILSPEGEVLCTKAQSGGFTLLRDVDGDVLLSTVGPLVFEGQPNLASKNVFQQAIELASHLRFSFDFTVLVEGTSVTGEDLVEADVPIQFSSAWRKLVIASLVDGYCGSDGLPQ